MLELSIRKGESVAVGGENPFERLLTVTVLEIASNRVRLSFEVKEDATVYPVVSRDRPRLVGARIDAMFGFPAPYGNC